MKVSHIALIMLLSIQLWFTPVIGQTFTELNKEAAELYAAGAYKESGQKYDLAVKAGSPSYIVYYNAACSWALAGETSKALKYLQLAADNGWSNLLHIKRDTDLESLRKEPEWEQVLAAVEANKLAAEKNFDLPLKNQLEELYARDQMLRQLIADVDKKFGAESYEKKYLWQLIAAEDKKNEAEIVELLAEKGWVGKSKIGGKANAAIWLVIQHAPLEMQKKYLPMLRQSVQEGESSGNHLALLEDRILMYEGKPQIYGSQYRKDPETGGWVFHKIQDPDNVNQRRASVGLEPIEEYARQFNIEWPVKQ